MAKYFCRVCDNSAGWVKPTNVARETIASHFGNFSFAYEEWNFSPSLFVDGWQYGWIEGFKSGQGRTKVPCGTHEIVLYVRRNQQAFAVGKLAACEKLASSHMHSSYPPALIGQANAVGASIAPGPHGSWNVEPTIARPRMHSYSQVPQPNMRFRPSDSILFSTAVAIPISYTRYGALLVTPANGRAPLWSMVPSSA